MTWGNRVESILGLYGALNGVFPFSHTVGSGDILIVSMEGILKRKWVLMEYVGVLVAVGMEASDKVS